MFAYPRFDVDVERSVDVQYLGWPEPGAAQNERNLGGNRDYEDLRRLPWSEAKIVFEEEGEIIRRIEEAENPEEEYDIIENDDADEPNGLYGLDIGVAAAVVALSAAKCVPFSSCNAGVFGDHHHEYHPVIAFYARPEIVPLLLECAEKAGAGLANTGAGGLIVYGNDIRQIRAFASSLIHNSAAFRRIRPTQRFSVQDTPEPELAQLKLL